MWLIRNPNLFGERLSLLFQKYRSDIWSNFLTQFKQEDISGESSVQYNNTILMATFVYACLFAKDYEDDFLTYEQVIQKYNIFEVQKCLACMGISLQSILKDIGIILEFDLDVDGIEHLGIENNFHIEFKQCPDIEASETVSESLYLQAKPNCCTIFITE